MSDFMQDNENRNSNSRSSDCNTSINTSQENIEENHVYINLLKIDEVFIYKIPPLKSASGHRAEDWNLAHPLFTGCLKLSQNDREVLISIYSYIDPKKTSVIDENIKLFGECHIAVKPGENILSYFDAVIDSSRYYVIRLRDPTSLLLSNHHHRSTLIGIGFRDREPAFDLKNCLNDYVKFINRMDLAAKLAISSYNNNNNTNGDVDHQQQQKDDDASTSSCLLDDDDGHNGDYKQASANSSKAGNTTNASSWGHINPLKDGEKIRLNINKNKSIIMVNSNKASIPPSPNADNTSTSYHSSSSSSSSSSKQLLLRPPPAAGSIVHYQSTTSTIISDTHTQQKLSLPSSSSSVLSNPSTSSLSTTTIISDFSAVVIEGEEDWSDFTSS